ncbi:MAG TPA: hypothetical protein VJN93_04455 [Candidatus Acidoferrum sp.]|nr:hypothetical protein [Candidatus Acidoferrum sp.]
MRKGYYNPMRNPAIMLPFLFAAIFLSTGVAGPRPQSTLRAAAVESHEGVTISAQALTDAEVYKSKFGKRSPLAAGIVAIDTAIRNDTDESMKVDLDQIRLDVALSEDNRQALRSLTADDVADVVMDTGKKDPTATRRLPFPLPSTGPRVGRDKHWMQVQRAAADAALPGSVVAPHQSIKGLLYFDIRGQFDLLDAAHLYVPSIRSLEKNHALLYFDIDLGK